MNVVVTQHLLEGARFVESPNQSERPADSNIDLLVIHNISLPPGEFGGTAIEELFCNKLDCSAHSYYEGLENLKVSAHLLIDREANITQFVPFNCKAWHAGQSQFEGRENCNGFSIGIELEGTDNTAFTDAQYDALVEVTLALLNAYPALTVDRIVGHSDIAPDRKTDPGPCFDWSRYRAGLADQTSQQGRRTKNQ
jgi:AmpD protein